LQQLVESVFIPVDLHLPPETQGTVSTGSAADLIFQVHQSLPYLTQRAVDGSTELVVTCYALTPKEDGELFEMHRKDIALHSYGRQNFGSILNALHSVLN
jgi:hypothetical protein